MHDYSSRWNSNAKWFSLPFVLACQCIDKLSLFPLFHPSSCMKPFTNKNVEKSIWHQPFSLKGLTAVFSLGRSAKMCPPVVRFKQWRWKFADTWNCCVKFHQKTAWSKQLWIHSKLNYELACKFVSALRNSMKNR